MGMSQVFETERLMVRSYVSADKLNFFLLNGNPDVVRYIRPAKSREECDAFLEQIMADERIYPLFGRWAVIEKKSKEFVGSFAVIPVENEQHMQLGYALLPEHWKKGFATELTRAGLEYVFSRTGLDTIYAYTEKPNLASQKVLLKCGFLPYAEKLEKGKVLVSFVYHKKDYEQRFEKTA
jgi:[ribosomal protein S5]-alanine N-acetyltransferase